MQVITHEASARDGSVTFYGRARDGSPVAQWAEAEMATTERRADGWLVVGGGAGAGRQVKSSGAAHVVIRPGTAASAEKRRAAQRRRAQRTARRGRGIGPRDERVGCEECEV